MSMKKIEYASYINQQIYECLEKLYKDDKHLILNKPENCDNKEISHVGERSIVFRFAHYLQSELEKRKEFSVYNLDCEYNRNGTERKNLPSFPNGTYPDVILHKRGSNDGNLLVMEFKTYWNPNQEKDKQKIKEFIDKNGNYKFMLGYSVLLNEEFKDVRIIDFQNDGENLENINDWKNRITNIIVPNTDIFQVKKAD